MLNDLLHHAFEIMNIVSMVLMFLALTVNLVAKHSDSRESDRVVYPALSPYVTMTYWAGFLFMVTDFLLQSAAEGGSGKIYEYYSPLLLQYADVWMVCFIVLAGISFISAAFDRKGSSNYSVVKGLVGSFAGSVFYYFLSYIMS